MATQRESIPFPDVPKYSVIYPDLVHAEIYALNDPKVNYETNSKVLKMDVIRLLGSPKDKFATSIGKGSLCQAPNRQERLSLKS